MARKKRWIAAAGILLLILFVAVRAFVKKDVEDMTAYELIKARGNAESNEGLHTAVVAVLGKVGVNTVPKYIDKITGYEYLRSLRVAFDNIGPDAVPSLIEALQDEEEMVRRRAAYALGHFGPDAEEVVPVLIKALQDEEKMVRLSAANALGNIGPEAKEAVPALVEMLKDDDEGVRGLAAYALYRIDPEAYPEGAPVKPRESGIRVSANSR